MQKLVCSYLWLDLFRSPFVDDLAPGIGVAPPRCLCQRFLIPNSTYIGYLALCTRLTRPPKQTKHVILIAKM